MDDWKSVLNELDQDNMQSADDECVTGSQNRSCSYPKVFEYGDVESKNIQSLF